MNDKKSKNENEIKAVHNYAYLFLILGMVTVFIYNASCNVNYGIESSGVQTRLMSIAIFMGFFGGELLLAGLVYMYSGKNITKAVCLIAITGLFFLSIFAGASFFVSSISKQDDLILVSINNQIKLKDEEILELKRERSLHPETGWWSKREGYTQKITSARNEIKGLEVKRQERIEVLGEGYKAGSTAIYHYIASFSEKLPEIFQLTGEQVAVIIRLIFSFTLVIAGVAVSAVLANCTCPFVAARVEELEEAMTTALAKKKEHQVDNNKKQVKKVKVVSLPAVKQATIKQEINKNKDYDESKITKSEHAKLSKFLSDIKSGKVTKVSQKCIKRIYKIGQDAARYFQHKGGEAKLLFRGTNGYWYLNKS